MNLFVVANAVLYICAAIHSGAHDRPGWSIVYLCYGVSAAVLAFLEGE